MLLSSGGVKALIVGTGTHPPPSRLPSVPAVAGTVRDLAECLVDSCGLPADAATVLVDPGSPAVLSTAIEEAAAAAEDVFFLWYVGHGLLAPAPDGSGRLELYLATAATVDLSRGRAASEALEYADIGRVVARCRARTVVVGLDCCFSGRATLEGIGNGVLMTSATREDAALAPQGAPHTVYSGELIRLLREGEACSSPQLTMARVCELLKRQLADRGGPAPEHRFFGAGGAAVLADNAAYQPPSRTEPPPVAVPGVEDRCPYRGLASFGASDARFFFGRDELTDTALQAAADHVRRGSPMIVVGASGAGKSSLLGGGLLSAIGRGRLGVAGSAGWPQLVLTPGARPLASLAACLAAHTGRRVTDVEELLKRRPESAGRLAFAYRPDAGGPARTASGGLVLVVDQFEEIFTHHVDRPTQQAFVRALVAIAAPPDPGERSALVVLGVRSDLAGNCYELPGLVTAMRSAVGVKPMTTGQLRAAITRPAALVGLSVEAGLAELLLQDAGADADDDTAVSHDAGSLPLLSHALLATWQRRRGRFLTAEDYRAVGRIRGAITTTADRVYESFDEAGRHALRRVLLALVHVTEEARPTGRRVERAGLPTGEHVEQALAALVEARLVTVDAGNVALSHEALISHWPTLRDWLRDGRDGLLTHRQLTDAVRVWNEHGREPSYLYGGARLAAARNWIDASAGPAVGPGASPAASPVAGPATSRGSAATVGGAGVLSADERAFLDASARRERRRKGARRLAVTVLTGLLVLASAASVVAFQQRQTKLRQQRVAVAGRLVAQSDALRDSSPDRAVTLAAIALRLARTEEARTSLATTLRRTYFRGSLPARAGNGASVAYSPDGRTLAVGLGGAAELWDMGENTGRDTGATARPARVASLGLSASTRESVHLVRLVFSPDGRTLLTLRSDFGILWDLSDRSRPSRLAVLNTAPGQAASNPPACAFSPDGHTILVAPVVGRASLWDVTERTHPTRLVSLPTRGDVSAAAFAPDGRRLATAGADRTVALWNTARRTRPRLVGTVRAGTAEAVAFSADGRTLATAGEDARSRLWDVTSPSRPTLLATLSGHTSSVDALSFGADGRELATASADGTAIRWDVTDRSHPRQAATLTAGHGSVRGVAFSPDGRTLAAVGDDGTTLLWSTGEGETPQRLAVMLDQPGKVQGVAISPDGKVLATDAADTVLLWDLRDPSRPARLASLTDQRLRHHGPASRRGRVAFSPDGRMVAVGGDPAAALWDVTDRRHPVETATLTGHGSGTLGATGVGAVAFSPDGRSLVTGGDDGRILLWDLGDRTRPRVRSRTTAHGDLVTAAAFSPDGRTLATASYDFTAKLWDVSDPAHPRELATAHHSWFVLAAAFSPDGRTLASTSYADTALWDVRDRSHPRRLVDVAGHTSTATSVAFSPDNRLLVTSGYDRKATVWDVEDPAHPGQLGTLVGQDGPLNAVAFQPGSRLLATGSDDRRVTLWDLAPLTGEDTDPLVRACAMIGHVPDRAEWRRDVPGLPYETVCPGGS